MTAPQTAVYLLKIALLAQPLARLIRNDRPLGTVAGARPGALKTEALPTKTGLASVEEIAPGLAVGWTGFGACLTLQNAPASVICTAGGHKDSMLGVGVAKRAAYSFPTKFAVRAALRVVRHLPHEGLTVTSLRPAACDLPAIALAPLWLAASATASGGS